jgi:hypothetical protein
MVQDISQTRLMMLFTEGLMEPLKVWVKAFKHVIAQFVARIKGLRFNGQTGVTGTNPTQCHHNGMVFSI